MPRLLPDLPGGELSDGVVTLRGELPDRDRELSGAISRTGDRTSRLHLQDARAQIERMLAENNGQFKGSQLEELLNQLIERMVDADLARLGPVAAAIK